MKKFKIILLLTVIGMCNLVAFAQQDATSEQLKPRVVVLTDVSTWETDDQESLVRFLAHADLFEIEGIVWTTGYSHSNISSFPSHYDIIQNVINAYDQDLGNLSKRSDQSEFDQDTTHQKIGYWPSADYLRDRTMWGSIHRGMEYIGEGNDSDGSNLIIELADEEDERPVWITVWGGGNTLAQAVWKVQQTRSEDELKDFLSQLRVYTITDQDRTYDGSEGYEVSSHQWLRDDFSEDLFFIWDECAWKFQNGTGRENWSEYETHIQGHGNLGNMYPKYEYGVEGDTPAFLHIIPIGLNNPEEPTQAGWGGYFEWGITADNETYAYTNHSGSANGTCNKYENHFYPATFNNFAARMDWAEEGEGNINPVAIVDSDSSLKILRRSPEPGETVVLNASDSYDPDGDELKYRWWVMPETGNYYTRRWGISNSDSSVATLEIPEDSDSKEFHLILEITDNGTPNLTSYRRIIFQPEISVGINEHERQSNFNLKQNYPNPFNPSTTIGYQLETSSKVTLDVFDTLGRKVANLVQGYESIGLHQVTWNAASMASGAYIYRIETSSGFTETRNMLLMK